MAHKEEKESKSDSEGKVREMKLQDDKERTSRRGEEGKFTTRGEEERNDDTKQASGLTVICVVLCWNV